MWVDQFAFHGEAYVDDVSYGKEFKNKTVLDQFNKIVAGETCRDVVKASKFKPLTKVVTDDGDEIEVNAVEAAFMRNIVMGIDVRSRLDILKKIQTTKGLTKLLEYSKIKLYG